MRNRGGRPRNPVILPEVPFQPRPEGGYTWYIGMVKPGARPHKTTAALVGEGFAAWCPLRLVERKHARSTAVVLDALWHPYLFVGLAAHQGIAKACETKGMLDVLRTDSGVAIAYPVERLQTEWDRLQQRGGVEDHTSPQNGPWANVKTGDPLRITEGPFAHFPGTFCGVDGIYIKIEVAILGRLTQVSISPDWVIRGG